MAIHDEQMTEGVVVQASVTKVVSRGAESTNYLRLVFTVVLAVVCSAIALVEVWTWAFRIALIFIAATFLYYVIMRNPLLRNWILGFRVREDSVKEHF